MSQSTLDPNPAPEGTAQEQAPARQGSAATHRRRRSTTRKTPPRQEQEQATSATAVVEPLPASQAPAEAVAPPELSAAAAETATPARPRAASRSRRRSANGRKNDVQLVIPPHAGEDSTTEKSAAPADDTEPVAEEPQTLAGEVRALPVTTEHVETAAASAREPAEAEATEAETPAEARTSPRRYRFDRKATAAPYAPASRPERLSGVRVIPSAEVAEVAEVAAPTEPVAPVQEPAAAHMAAPEERYEVSALEEQARASGALDDIVSALGLRDAAPRREPLRLPVEIEAPAAEETTAEGAEEASEAEEPSAAETEASGTSRRRRRRRRGGAHATSAGEEDAEEMLETAPRRPTPLTEPEPAKRNGYSQYAGQEYGEELEPIYTPYGETARQPWDITQAQAQSRQPESPFEAPEPSTVRGFGPQPRGVAGPAREPFTRPGRVERTDVPPMSSNQLASMVTHAIQQQTDRLLNELHYRAQPPGMTVMLPSLPSTERVGVFVDVANLLYSSRNLRLAVDFGKLLEFLRGNRRLVRAHAYAPTNPDPHADQSFLQAVKGLGYRITTKNYKTFASGAKKADMDLDLCMDIVRMVDAGAVDTIVLVSGDSDFLPLLEYCSDHGVRVEVAAFEDAAAAILRQSCDLFINLSLVDDIRA